jgi:two-component system, response regulator PdtaR
MPDRTYPQTTVETDGQTPSDNTSPTAQSRILIAEDDPLVAQDLKERLEMLEYDVCHTTASGQEAVEAVARLNPGLVLMDIQLKGEVDGIQAAEQIRSLAVPVVYVTGYCDGLVLERAKKTEPYGYILKPYETRDLKATIEIGLCKHRAEREREVLLKQLQNALAGLKALSGLLSICAYCKKIKDGTRWSEIETYIMAHSQTSFTHGMCPDCFNRVKQQLDELAANGSVTGSVVIG